MVRGGKDFDYRADYFRRHKGLFGSGIYFCSYCGKPVRKKGSHIDHIIPKSKNQELLNRSFNTTIACAKCNLKKSDKMDYRIVQGYASKVGGAAVGTAVGGSYRVAKGTLQGTAKVAGYSAKGGYGVAKYGTKGAFWVFKQMFRGMWSVVSTIVSTLLKVMLKNWVITGIVGYIIFLKYM